MWVYINDSTVRKFRIVNDPYFLDPEHPEKLQKFPDIFKSVIEKRTDGKFEQFVLKNVTHVSYLRRGHSESDCGQESRS